MTRAEQLRADVDAYIGCRRDSGYHVEDGGRESFGVNADRRGHPREEIPIKSLTFGGVGRTVPLGDKDLYSQYPSPVRQSTDRGDVSPRWATVEGYGLYFYANERHRRPHVDVVNGRQGGIVDVATGELLAGDLPPKVLRAARALLAEYREEAISAFNETLEHHFPGALDPKKEVDDE